VAEDGSCQSEVEHFHFAFGRHLHIRRFEVAVNDAFGVRRFQRLRNLVGVIERCFDRQRSSQRLAFDQLKYEAIEIARFFETIDSRDIRVIQRSQCARFAAEANHPLRVACELRRQRLDCHIAIELIIVRPVHFSHSAGA
jgi:hypothetical protein